jgi:hypothetical protein
MHSSSATNPQFDIGIHENNWSSYKGFFKDGKRHGIGKIRFDGLDMFEGEFKDGKADGYGLFTLGLVGDLEKGNLNKGK